MGAFFCYGSRKTKLPTRSWGRDVKPHPAPQVPGNTDAERMSNALRMVLTVSKKDLLKKEERLKRASEKKQAKRKD